MHPSTLLTPADWKFTSIHPDVGGRFKLAGFASQEPWRPGDLKALGVKVKGNKTWGLTKERALEIGFEIEQSMRKQNGKPLLKEQEIMSKPLSPIERMIDAAVKCVKCGAKKGECNCFDEKPAPKPEPILDSGPVDVDGEPMQQKPEPIKKGKKTKPNLPKMVQKDLF